MGQHRNILKRLRAIVLDHATGDHPDLASMARELGQMVHQDSAAVATGLASLRQYQQGFERWKLASRNQPALSVLVMAWPPNHATPVHDHANLWGLEMSLTGALEVQAYERDPATGDLRAGSRDWLGPGDNLWFDADHGQTHRCRNLSRRETALSLHVYGGELDTYSTYEQTAPSGLWIAHARRHPIATRLPG